jgi:hypothetical protein
MADQELILTYQLQLAQINECLLSDPQNAEYLSMRNDLLEAIALMQELQEKPPTEETKRVAPSPPSETEWKVGDRCQFEKPTAKEMLTGTITSISIEKNTATVLLPSCEAIKVPLLSLKKPDPKRPQQQKKKKNESYQKQKDQEHNDRAQSWKSFQSKLSTRPSPSLFHSARRTNGSKPY